MSNRLVLVLMVFVATLGWSTSAQAQYRADWSSLDQRPIPEWYTDSKFGIFIHWGTYSVPAYAPVEDVGLYAKYAEWYWRRSTNPDAEGYDEFTAFHNRVYGEDVTYQDFARMFEAEMYEPEKWARIFKDAGAQYVVLTSKHHEGFTLWPSEYSWNWNAVDIGPNRDLAGDFMEAMRDAGLKAGFYYSLYEWYNPQYRNDLQSYIDDYMWPQLKELVVSYEPDIVWADGEWDHESEVWGSEAFLAWLYNESPVAEDVVVNDRWGEETRSKHGGFYTTEYAIVHGGEGIDEEAAMHPWEETRGIGGSFGYNRNEDLEHYSTSEELVEMLVDIVSNGGNFLLNVGPTADGRIPVIMQQRLHDMGEWLDVAGEAIYGTERWLDAPDEAAVRYTRKGDDLYAITLSWPGPELELPISPGRGAEVTLLGHEQALEWRRDGSGIVVEVPALSIDEVPTRYAHAFRIRDAF